MSGRGLPRGQRKGGLKMVLSTRQGIDFNSTSNIMPKETDSANKLHFLFGSLQVSARDIEPYEWLEIIRHILDLCKPYLKYMPRFMPIGDYLNCQFPGCGRRQTSESIMEFPEEISERTRCLTVEKLSFEKEGEHEDRQYGMRFVTERALLLSQEGKWLQWEFKYERVVEHGLGKRKRRNGIAQVAKVCRFSVLEEDGLLDLLEKRKGLGLHILEMFKNLASRGVEERKARLQQIKRVEEALIEIKEKIAW
jgi:hypothetical protein